MLVVVLAVSSLLVAVLALALVREVRLRRALELLLAKISLPGEAGIMTMTRPKTFTILLMTIAARWLVLE